MRHLAFLTLLAFLPLLAACTIDAYEKGEGEYSLLTAELVEAYVDNDKHVSHVVTDQGEHLILTSPLTAQWIETPDTMYRALLYYDQVEEGKAEPRSFGWVGVLTPRDSIKGGMKSDPLYTESMWVAKNHKYLNLRLRLLTGSTDDEKARHSIGLMKDASSSTPGHARMVLYHDQGGMPEYYSMVTYASIPLDSIKADTLTIVVKTYNGEVNRTFKLRSSDSSVVL
ncbi:MAG: hypothetical protein K6A96_15980 [Prevotella sp.]|nr:hypothetical protein [Prevotella sp.]